MTRHDAMQTLEWRAGVYILQVELTSRVATGASDEKAGDSHTRGGERPSATPR